jgi:Family of unknown function (DUF6088)
MDKIQMTDIAKKIMKTVRRHGRGNRVYRARDFLHLGSDSAVWQALSRLTKAGEMRRIARGLYDYPRHSKLLDAAVPASTDVVAKSLGAIAKDDIAAANALGVTTAVSVRTAYLTGGPTRMCVVGNRTIELKHAPLWVTKLVGTPALPFVQALNWLGPNVDDVAVDKLRSHVTDDVRRALNGAYVPGRLRKHINELTTAAG